MMERPSGLGAQDTPEFAAQRERWKAKWSSRTSRRSEPGSGAVDRTISDLPLKPLYGPEDVAHLDLARDLAFPGEYPYTRGIHAGMYRDRLWTMRQFAGFGNAEQTNERYHFLLAQGQTACRSHSTCRRSWATTPTRPRPAVRWAAAASLSTRCATWSNCSPGSTSGRSRRR